FGRLHLLLQQLCLALTALALRLQYFTNGRPQALHCTMPLGTRVELIQQHIHRRGVAHLHLRLLRVLLQHVRSKGQRYHLTASLAASLNKLRLPAMSIVKRRQVANIPCQLLPHRFIRLLDSHLSIFSGTIDKLAGKHGATAEQIPGERLPELRLFCRAPGLFRRRCFWFKACHALFGGTDRELGCGHAGGLKARQALTSYLTLLWRRWGIGDAACNHTVAIHFRANTFERAQDHTIFVAQHNIADAAHNLDDQTKTHALIVLAAAIPGDDLQHAFPARLHDSFDPRPLQIFAQQHHERGRLTRNLSRLERGQMRPRQLWMRREIEPTILPALALSGRGVTLERNRILGRLNNCVNTSIRQQKAPLISHCRQRNSIYMHRFSLILITLLGRSLQLPSSLILLYNINISTYLPMCVGTQRFVAGIDIDVQYNKELSIRTSTPLDI